MSVDRTTRTRVRLPSFSAILLIWALVNVVLLTIRALAGPGAATSATGGAAAAVAAAPPDAVAAAAGIAWSYFNSTIFQIVTVALAFPLVLKLIDDQFRIRDAIEKRDEERTKAAEVAEKARLDAERARRQQAAARVLATWGDVNRLAGEVRFYSIDAGRDRQIFDILRDLSLFPHTAEQVNLEVSFAFQGAWATPESGELFWDTINDSYLTLLNALFEPSVFVATKLLDAGRQPGEPVRVEIRRAQEHLGVIADGVKSICNQSVTTVLNSAITLLDPEELRTFAAKFHRDDVAAATRQFREYLGWGSQQIRLGARQFIEADERSRRTLRGIPEDAADRLHPTALALARYVQEQRSVSRSYSAHIEAMLVRDFRETFGTFPEGERIFDRGKWFDDHALKAYAEAATSELLVRYAVDLLSSRLPAARATEGDSAGTKTEAAVTLP